MTGKENKITIKANSGLTETEIQKMVKDAELHADEDKNPRALVDARNQGDALVHSSRKALTGYGGTLDGNEKHNVESAVQEMEVALKGSDKATIDAKIAALSAAAQKMHEKMAGNAQAGQAASAAAGAEQGQRPEEDVLDAVFKEVDDKK